MVEYIEDPVYVVVASLTASFLGAFGGIFCLIVIIRLRIHKQISLILVHSGTLLLLSLVQITLWPAIFYTRPAPVVTQQRVCHSLKLLEMLCRALTNIASSAMVLWYMHLNRLMAGESSLSLEEINRKTTIYFCVVGIGAVGLIIGCTVGDEVTMIGTIYCFITITASYEMMVLRLVLQFFPIYVPLLLGMIWFAKAGKPWINHRQDGIPAERIHRRVKRLFYWFNWSFMVSQMLVLICNFTFIMYYQMVLREVMEVATHIASIQTVLDGAAVYFILLRPSKRDPEETSMVDKSTSLLDETKNSYDGEFLHEPTRGSSFDSYSYAHTESM